MKLRGWAWAAGAALVLGLGLAALLRRRGPGPVPVPEAGRPGPSAAVGPAAAPTAVPKARLAVVIDDWGYQKAPVERLAGMGFPLTVSVLPNLKYSRAAADAGHAAGDEVILHCPMQSVRPIPRERNTLLTTMTASEADAALQTDWDSVPWRDGMNNHEGSKASADRPLMDIAAAFLKSKGAFFLDSVTTPRSAIPGAARAAGVRWARRRVFLDNVDRPEAIERQLKLAAELARRNGSCIAIGHPRRNTLDVLEREAPRLEAAGITWVRVGTLVHP